MSDLYHPAILETWNSVISGKGCKLRVLPRPELTGIPLVAAFLADDDVQEITIVSTNIGFVRKLRKFHASAPLPTESELQP